MRKRDQSPMDALEQAMRDKTLKSGSIGRIDPHINLSEIPAVAGSLLPNYRCEVDRAQWLRFIEWSATEAAWLLMDIDPRFTDPVWRLPPPERQLRELAGVAEAILRQRVGPTGQPKQYVAVLAEVNAAWAEWAEDENDDA